MPFLIVIILVLFLIFPSVRRHPDRAAFKNKFFAHRGLYGNSIPENSLSAFANAVANGYGIELDIHLTADGELVVFHDYELKRMCNVEGRIEEKNLVELRELTLANSNEKIPTFKEVLSLVDGRVPIIVEFKSLSLICDELCVAADKLLNRYNGKYCIESFNPMAVSWYRKNRKDVFRGQLAMNSKNKGFISKLSSNFWFNFLARPDFVSYEQKNSNNVCFKIQKFLGAFSVGWTFGSEEELEEKKNQFEAYIFENFKP